METEPPVVSAVVLAAGTSSRLGRPKQLLDLDGRPLLQHVIDAVAAASVAEIIVVLGYQAERIAAALELPPNARIVVNDDYQSGLSSSLRAGLDAAGRCTTAAAILLGDQPRLPSRLIRRALDAFGAGSAPILRTVWQGTPGHPVIVDRSYWDLLRRSSGDRGARDFLSSLGHAESLEMGRPPVEDVDTWDEYTALKERT